VFLDILILKINFFNIFLNIKIPLKNISISFSVTCDQSSSTSLNLVTVSYLLLLVYAPIILMPCLFPWKWIYEDYFSHFFMFVEYKENESKKNPILVKKKNFMTGNYFPFLILRKTLFHEAPLLYLVFIFKNSVSLFNDNVYTSKPHSNIIFRM